MNHSIHTINQDFVDRRNERVVINIIPRDWVEMVEKRYCVERGLNRCGRGRGGRCGICVGRRWKTEVVLDKISHCIQRENRISVGQKLKLLQGTRRNCGNRSTISRRYRCISVGTGRRDWQPITKRRRVVVKLIYHRAVSPPPLVTVTTVRYFRNGLFNGVLYPRLIEKMENR